MLSGWKTLIFNTIVALLGVMAAFDWTTVIDHPEATGIVMAAIGVINVILRFLTKTPPGTKKLSE